MQFLRFLFCLSLLVTTAWAQTVRWQNNGTGNPADLQLVYENCQPNGDPQLPAIDGARLNFNGRSEQTSIINFSVTRSVVFSYRLQIGQAATDVTIPSFKVSTDKGELTVPAYQIGTVQPGPEADIRSSLTIGKDTIWAGEVFPITYGFDVARRSFSNFGSEIDWDSTPAIIEEWGKYQAAESNRNGETRLLVAFRNRGYIPSAGNYELNPVNQILNLTNGTVGFRLFQQQRIDPVTVSTDPVEITVRPLPPAPDDGFSGAVGQFKLTSKIVPAESAVGEPITWTLELSGSGNWPEVNSLPSRSVSRDFQVISPEAKKTPEEGKLFDATLSEDVVLVPTKPGTYTLGAVEFTYFNPETGEYVTARTPAKTITVAAAPTGHRSTPPAPTEPDRPETTAAPTATAPSAPADPQGIPRDPIPGSATAPTPFASLSLVARYAAIPFGVVLIAWLALAARRAAQTDPHNARRTARQQLHETLTKLHEAGSSAQSRLLTAWQHQTAQLWSFEHAAPSSSAFTDPEWATLWTESEQALYSSQAKLPSDWLARAEAALSAYKVPGIAWHRTFLPRNLLPILIVVLCLGTANSLQAEEASEADEAYQSGKFSSAESIWRQQVETTPTDWIAHHNLSLALAQQDRWQEAAAHASAAFLQEPRADHTRWNLALAYEKAGYTPTAIAPLLESHPLTHLARLASAPQWERVTILGAVIAALAILLILLVAYRLTPRTLKLPALIALVLGFTGIAAGITGRHTYGIAAHPQVALIWHDTTLYSIPTEADTTQQTTPLSAGTMGILSDQHFLGWVHLTFPNGQTGWARQDDLVTIWK